MSGFAYGFQATVERPSGFDRDGVAKTPETHTIGNCVRDQTNSLETVDGIQVVVTRERLLCDDTAADVEPADILILPDGTRWQVTGEIDRPVSPWDGWAPGCVIPIERASGPTQPQE